VLDDATRQQACADEVNTQTGDASSERTRAELEQALKTAEDALRVRDDFLRLAGHELRSPLTAVQLQSDALSLIVRQGGSAIEIEERAARVKRSVGRLAWLVEEVVDLGRASGGRLALHAGRTDLVMLARRVLDRFGDELLRASCETTLAANGPVSGIWDAQRIEHAIGSLLLAALKTGGGHPIDMEVGVDHGGASARVTVRVQGPSLSSEECELVFAAFDQLLARLQPGSPILGLWLARAVAEGHGGFLTLAPGLAALELPKTGGAAPGLIGDGSGPP
jgi:signal transduction histidine kinase